MIVHYNINVHGKVQGVFYRASTLDKAQQIGVQGFVKNCADGSVYIEAEGTEEQLYALVDWCKQGPARSTVENVSFTAGQIKGFDGFSIKY